MERGLMDDDGLDMNMVLQVVEQLAQPLHAIGNEVRIRRQIPKNQFYYEETIPRYSDILFREHFRMSREAFEILTGHIAHLRPNLVIRAKIPLEKKLLFLLWILGKPESFQACGDRFGMARSTAYFIFTQIIEVFVEMLPQQITWPANYEIASEVFRERSYCFPDVIGAIDSCHIRIKQPTDNAYDYYNRNKYQSIILQGVADHNLRFIDVFVGLPGRMHDARVFRNSEIYARITNNANPLLPPENHLLGDSAYPLMLNIMTPFRDNGHLNRRQINYNTKLSSIRSVVERAFGRLKGKFRRLKDLDISTAEMGTNIIAAACVLHNFIIDNDNDEEVYNVEPEILQHEYRDPAYPRENRELGAIKGNRIMNML